MTKPRPIPADFVEKIGTMNTFEAMEYFRTGDNQLRRWMRETGATSRGSIKRVLPDNIDELAKGRSIAQLAKLLGWPHGSLMKRLKTDRPDLHAACAWVGNCSSITALAKTQPPAPLTPPDDFEAMCERLTLTGLSQHYRRHADTIRRWLASSSAEARDAVTRNASRARSDNGKDCMGKIVAQRKQFQLRQIAADTSDKRPMSQADLAMRWLQHKGVCYPRRVHGEQYGGYVFSLCQTVLSADELIAEAKRRGWQPAAWPVAA